MSTSDKSAAPANHHVVICLGQSLLKNGHVPLALHLRVKHALFVYNRLASAGSASLYVSGADVAGRGKLKPEGLIMLELLLEQGIVAADVDVDTKAFNTIENAQNLIQAIIRRGATAVTLVTSDFHAPRSAYIFKTVLAAEGFHSLCMFVDPAPSGLANGTVRPRQSRPREINEWNFLERIDHETELMQNRMKAWLLEYRYESCETNFERALHELRSWGASIRQTFIVDEHVKVRDHPEDPWTRGVVTSISPLKVQCEGYIGPLTFEEVQHFEDQL